MFSSQWASKSSWQKWDHGLRWSVSTALLVAHLFMDQSICDHSVRDSARYCRANRSRKRVGAVPLFSHSEKAIASIGIWRVLWTSSKIQIRSQTVKVYKIFTYAIRNTQQPPAEYDRCTFYHSIVTICSSLINCQTFVKAGKSFKKFWEQIDCWLNIMRSCSFTDRMHRKHRVSDVNCAEAKLRQHWSDSWSTGPEIVVSWMSGWNKESSYISLRTSNSWTFPPLFATNCFTMNVVTASVAYRCLALVLMTTPPFITGLWFSSCFEV